MWFSHFLYVYGSVSNFLLLFLRVVAILFSSVFYIYFVCFVSTFSYFCDALYPMICDIDFYFFP